MSRMQNISHFEQRPNENKQTLFCQNKTQAIPGFVFPSYSQLHHESIMISSIALMKVKKLSSLQLRPFASNPDAPQT